MKIVLIDGHSIINRAFYGMPLLTNSEGRYTGAVYGFLTILFKILDEEKPDYLTVAFDVKAPTFRHEMYKEYKGQRKPMPKELHEQVELLKEVLKAMNIKIISKAGLEADDLIGTVGHRCDEMGMEVTIISGDKDLLQLATDRVLVRIPSTKKGVTTIEDFHAKDVHTGKGVKLSPKQFIDFKALMGDPSDNYSGVVGIGEKGATDLLVEYGSLEGIYENIDSMKKSATKDKLIAGKEDAFFCRDLATIRINADFDYDLEDALIRDMFNEEAFKLFVKLEFKKLLNRFDESPKGEEVNVLSKIKAVVKPEEAKTVLEGIKQGKSIIGINRYEETDAQGDVLDRGVTLYWGEEIYFISEAIADGELINEALLSCIKNSGKAVFIDLKSKLKLINIEEGDNVYDASIGAYLLNPLKSDYKYDDILNDLLGQSVLPEKELVPKKLKEELISNNFFGFTYACGACGDDFNTFPDGAKSFIQAKCLEAFAAYESIEVLLGRLEETGMLKLYKEIEMPLVYTLDSMEKEGIKVDREELIRFSTSLNADIDRLEKSIYEKAGEEFNINSPKQLGVILFEKLGLPSGKKTKSGYSTSVDVLEKLSEHYEIVRDVLDYRQLAKLKSTYGEGLQPCIKEDGRIHSTFNQTITATGRISSTEPNLQNIPIRMEMGRLIRKCFVPKEDFVFIDADYSQIELRVLADMSKDQTLIDAYNSSADIHSITASQVFKVPLDEVTPTMRRNAKAVNFGIIYGISSFGLSRDLSISKKEAKEYIDRYFMMYPAIKEFLDGLISGAMDLSYSVTSFARRRPIPELKSSNFMQREFGKRVAMNSPIQGTAADIIKIAMINVDRELKKQGLKSRLILQVHDELLIECHKDETERVKEILKDKMMNAAKLAVALEIDMCQGNNWYEAK